MSHHALLDNMIKNGTVRLSNGLTQYEGEVEIYLNSQWRSVRYDGWDEFDAKVVCREISYLSTSVEVKGIITHHRWYPAWDILVSIATMAIL